MHLETRDAYTPDDPLYLGWLEGKPVPEPALPDWYDLVRAQVARGIRFRRARIVSEPLSPFVRFEHGMTSGMNIAAGEDVRWLPRRLTPACACPCVTSGCSMTGSSGSGISQVTARSWSTSCQTIRKW